MAKYSSLCLEAIYSVVLVSIFLNIFRFKQNYHSIALAFFFFLRGGGGGIFFFFVLFFFFFSFLFGPEN